MSDLVTIFALSLASNLAPRTHIQTALYQLRQQGRCQLSAIYEMPCRDGLGEDYWNMAILLETLQAFEHIDALTKLLEQQSGRQRPSHCISLDIDIIAWGDSLDNMQYNSKKLPLAADVIIPLREIWSAVDQQHVMNLDSVTYRIIDRLD